MILLKQKAGVSEKVMQEGDPHIERDCTSFQRNPIGLYKGEIQTLGRRVRIRKYVEEVERLSGD